jgi:hypothetical protein
MQKNLNLLSMRDYRYTNTFANFQDNFYERDEKFNYFYDIVYSILFELYDKEYNDNILETTIQNVLSNYNDGYFTYNYKSIYNIIRNTVLKYRVYKDQSFHFNPGILSQDTFISAIQSSNYYDNGKEFYVSIAALYATLIILEEFVAFCYKNSDYTFKTSSTQYLNALTTYYQNTLNLINNTSLIASYIFGNYAINAYDSDNYSQFIQQITSINIIDNPIYVTRKNDTLILTSFTTEINSLKYTYSTTLPLSNYFKLPTNIPEGYYYQTNYRQLYSLFENTLFAQLNDLLYTTAYLSRSFYPDARLQQLRQNLNIEIVVSINNNRFILTILDIIKAITLSYYKLIYKTVYEYNFDLENLLSYTYINFNPEIYINEYLYNKYGSSYTHNYLYSLSNISNTLYNLNSTHDFVIYLVNTLPADLIKNINQYPDFVLINFPAYLQLIDFDFDIINITQASHIYLEFYLLYNVIPFRILKYYNLLNINLPLQPIKISNIFTQYISSSFRSKISLSETLHKTTHWFTEKITTNDDISLVNNKYCKNYLLDMVSYSYIYACSLYPANTIELSNSYIYSYTVLQNIYKCVSYTYEILNNNACSYTNLINNYSLTMPNHYTFEVTTISECLYNNIVDNNSLSIPGNYFNNPKITNFDIDSNLFILLNNNTFELISNNCYTSNDVNSLTICFNFNCNLNFNSYITNNDIIYSCSSNTFENYIYNTFDNYSLINNDDCYTNLINNCSLTAQINMDFCNLNNNFLVDSSSINKQLITTNDYIYNISNSLNNINISNSCATLIINNNEYNFNNDFSIINIYECYYIDTVNNCSLTTHNSYIYNSTTNHNNVCTFTSFDNYSYNTNIAFSLINNDDCEEIINENKCYAIDLVCNNDYSILDSLKLINLCGDNYVCFKSDLQISYEILNNIDYDMINYMHLINTYDDNIICSNTNLNNIINLVCNNGYTKFDSIQIVNINDNINICYNNNNNISFEFAFMFN